MPLSLYQLNVLRDFRTDEMIYGITLLTLSTGAGYSAFDAYKKQTWVTTTSYFSGALLWNPYSSKQDSEGGFTKLADVVIIASRDNRTSAQSKDAKISYGGVNFRISKVIDCEDSGEIVIYASKLE